MFVCKSAFRLHWPHSEPLAMTADQFMRTKNGRWRIASFDPGVNLGVFVEERPAPTLADEETLLRTVLEEARRKRPFAKSGCAPKNNPLAAYFSPHTPPPPALPTRGLNADVILLFSDDEEVTPPTN